MAPAASDTESSNNVKVFEGKSAPDFVRFNGQTWPLVGPFIEAKQKFHINHPEHADYIELPPGCYQITHQMDPRTEKAVLD